MIERIRAAISKQAVVVELFLMYILIDYYKNIVFMHLRKQKRRLLFLNNTYNTRSTACMGNQNCLLFIYLSYIMTEIKLILIEKTIILKYNLCELG